MRLPSASTSRKGIKEIDLTFTDTNEKGRNRKETLASPSFAKTLLTRELQADV